MQNPFSRLLTPKPPEMPEEVQTFLRSEVDAMLDPHMDYPSEASLDNIKTTQDPLFMSVLTVGIFAKLQSHINTYWMQDGREAKVVYSEEYKEQARSLGQVMLFGYQVNKYSHKRRADLGALPFEYQVCGALSHILGKAIGKPRDVHMMGRIFSQPERMVDVADRQLRKE